MSMPRQSGPIPRNVYRRLTPVSATGLGPSGYYTQCCNNGCTTVFCFLGLREKGCCRNGNPYVCCIGGSSDCPASSCNLNALG